MSCMAVDLFSFSLKALVVTGSSALDTGDTLLGFSSLHVECNLLDVFHQRCCQLTSGKHICCRIEDTASSQKIIQNNAFKSKIQLLVRK